MGFRKDADKLVISFHWEELVGGAKERKPTYMNTRTHGERGETLLILEAENCINGS